MSEPKLCKWHKCINTFMPEHANTVYCSDECRKKRLDWTKARGSRVVNRILSTSSQGLLAVVFDEQQKLLTEINGEAPLATKREIRNLKNLLKRLEHQLYNG